MGFSSSVLGIRDITTDEAVWSAEATELIKLGKDMIIASPESYLCFVNHPLEETITDDPMENIAEPPAKVARTASTGARKKPHAVSSRQDNHGRHSAFPQESKGSASSTCGINGVLINRCAEAKSSVAAHPQRREEDGC